MAKESIFTSNMIKRIIESALYWLGSSRSFSSPAIEFRGKRRSGRFFILITRVNDSNIHIQEIVAADDGVNRIFRNWTFRKDDEWQVLSLEKDGKQVVLVDLADELAELNAGIDTVYEKSNNSNLYFDEEVLSLEYNEGYSSYTKPKGPVRRFIHGVYHELALHPAVFVPVLSLAVVVLAIFVAGYFIQVNRIQNDLGSTMDEYLLQIKGQVQNLDDFMVEAEGDLEVLKDNLEKSKSDFEFNRHNAYANVMRLSEELTKYLPARKEAYKLIASNIEEAVSYGEIIYEMSKLPSEEYQARIFLATEEQRVIPLSRYIPVFDNMVYPVAIEGRGNDGRGFRITDGFMESRQDPLGSGGVAPHYAVDIINVGNIDFISYAGEIIREGMPAGDVSAAYEGVVKEITHDEAHYGWTVEIEHALTKEVKTRYPDAESWTTFYAHLYEEPVKLPNDWVNTGEKVGLIGNTGKSTGPHLHFEVRVYRPGGMYWTDTDERYDKIQSISSGKEEIGLYYNRITAGISGRIQAKLIITRFFTAVEKVSALICFFLKSLMFLNTSGKLSSESKDHSGRALIITAVIIAIYAA